MTIAPLAPDHAPEPFDPRIELTDHGFAVDFGPEWVVGFDSPGSLTGGPTVLTTETFDLSGYAGSSIKVGFRAGWDCNNCPDDQTARGWFIDNVIVWQK